MDALSLRLGWRSSKLINLLGGIERLYTRAPGGLGGGEDLAAAAPADMPYADGS
jgi:hypothetical protein